MKIESKFDVGDEVYFTFSDEVICEEIIEVLYEDGGFQYIVRVKGYRFQLVEDKVFATRELWKTYQGSFNDQNKRTEEMLQTYVDVLAGVTNKLEGELSFLKRRLEEFTQQIKKKD